MKTVFLHAFDADDKSSVLQRLITDPGSAPGGERFEVDIGGFSSVPDAPFVYRVPAAMLALAAARKTLIASGAKAKQGFGASTRFHRLVWEVHPRDVGVGHRWLWLAHGTRPVSFYKPTSHVVLWANEGHEAKADVVTRYPYLNGNYGFKIQAEGDYGTPGLCYGKRTNRFTVQVMPAGHAFSFEGTAIHVSDFPDAAWPLLALLNSKPVAFWLENVTAQHKTYSYVDATPIPSDLGQVLGSLARRGWQAQFAISCSNEPNNYFTLPALLQVGGDGLRLRSDAWLQRVHQAHLELDRISDEIDEQCYALYGLGEADRRAVAHGSGVSVDRADEDEDEHVGEPDGVDEAATDSVSLTAELVSWAVGVAFGRFDVQLATGARALPDEPAPFDPLPVCSPGMLTGDDGLPAPTAPDGYPLAFPDDGVLVDDPGHRRDLVAAVRAVFETVFGADADARWSEAAESLDPNGRDLRNWLSRGFFEHHLKRYSKSRRKAPIVWQMATPSTSYSVWLYAHRLTPDSVFQVQNDVVGPRLALEERRHTALLQAAGPNPSASQRREIAEAETFVDELRTFLAEVSRVAPLWNSDLDDGVVLTMAPLWRLVPQHRVWQRGLKSAWDALLAGKSDWAHLAMHLWPERVVPKCATDRSLAIAHDLEDVFWVEDAKGKWHPRSTPAREIEELVRERTSPAVKAALQSMVDAPAAASGGRGRARTGSARRAG